MTGRADTDALGPLAHAKPALKSQVQFIPQVHRGRRWFLLADRASGTQLMLDRPAFEIASLLDGERTVAACLEQSEADPEDFLALLRMLTEAELLQGDLGVSASALLDRHRERRGARLAAALARPLSLRFPLVDPSPLLRRLEPLAGVLFSRAGLGLWSLLVFAAVLVALREADALAAFWAARYEDPVNFLWLLALYPVVKGLHELGHGLAAQRFGAQLHELGVMLLVFVPVPYVDASATSEFRSARHRMIVAAAGILTETLLASLAILAWSRLETGLLRDLMFDVALIGGVSTVLFNGNPLLRFDGYYVLADALEIPNLGPRAQAWLGHRFRVRVLGLDEATPDTAPGERAWFLGYGIASAVYRLFLGVAIALFVGGQFFVIGVLLAFWFLWQQMVKPLLLGLLALVPRVREEGRLLRLGSVAAVTGLGAVVLLLGVPVPRSTIAEGVLLPPADAVVRAEAPGFVTSRAEQTGARVTAGAPLLALYDAELEQEERSLLAQVDELDARIGVARRTDRVEAQQLRRRRETVRAELARTRETLAALQVLAPAGGRMNWAPSVRAGAFVRQGDVLGYISTGSDRRIRALVAQHDIDRVRGDRRAVQVVSRSEPFVVLGAHVVSETPRAVDRLPVRTLGSRGGGAIPVDGRDPEGLELLEPMFEIELRLEDEDAGHQAIGQRYLVRFVHRPEELGPRLLQRAVKVVRERLEL